MRLNRAVRLKLSGRFRVGRHVGSTVLAETAEESQDFFQQFFSDRRNHLYKKRSEAAADTSNAEDVLRSGLFE